VPLRRRSRGSTPPDSSTRTSISSRFASASASELSKFGAIPDVASLGHAPPPRRPPRSPWRVDECDVTRLVAQELDESAADVARSDDTHTNFRRVHCIRLPGALRALVDFESGEVVEGLARRTSRAVRSRRRRPRGAGRDCSSTPSSSRRRPSPGRDHAADTARAGSQASSMSTSPLSQCLPTRRTGPVARPWDARRQRPRSPSHRAPDAGYRSCPRRRPRTCATHRLPLHPRGRASRPPGPRRPAGFGEQSNDEESPTFFAVSRIASPHS